MDYKCYKCFQEYRIGSFSDPENEGVSLSKYDLQIQG